MLEHEYKIVFLPIAEADLSEIVLYISREFNNPVSALRVMKKIREAIFERRKAPESFQKCRFANTSLDTYYRINVGKHYSVFYVVNDSTMEIRRILYSARDVESLLL